VVEGQTKEDKVVAVAGEDGVVLVVARWKGACPLERT